MCFENEANITVTHGLSVNQVKVLTRAYAYPNPATEGELFVYLGKHNGVTLTAT